MGVNKSLRTDLSNEALRAQHREKSLQDELEEDRRRDRNWETAQTKHLQDVRRTFARDAAQTRQQISWLHSAVANHSQSLNDDQIALRRHQELLKKLGDNSTHQAETLQRLVGHDIPQAKQRLKDLRHEMHKALEDARRETVRDPDDDKPRT